MRPGAPSFEPGKRGRLSGLWRRTYLTLKYEGPRGAARRLVVLVLRFTPRARRLRLGRLAVEAQIRARVWYRHHRRPVHVMPPAGGGAIAERLAGGRADLVICDSGLRPARAWLESLQHAAYAGGGRVGIVGARVLDVHLRIEHAGLCRDRDHPDNFVTRYGGRGLDFGPAEVRTPVLAVAPEGMYIRRVVLDRIGMPDDLSTVYGAVDYCLRAWQSGFEVQYEPAAMLERLAGSPSRGDADSFWERWRAVLDQREVTAPGGGLRIVYVTEGTGLWGGHRVIFEDLNRLAEGGHDVTLFTLEAPPDWFDLRAPVRTFGTYAELEQSLAPLPAIKVATWWRTAPVVWRASVRQGVPVYFVQDIETSYYPDSEAARHEVLAGYREEFRFLTTSGWNRQRLEEMGHDATVIPPALDSKRLQTGGRRERERAVLAFARADPLKRFDLTVAAWQALSEPRPELWLVGSDPRLAPPGARYLGQPSDADVIDLMGRCAVFVQTSAHEGFGLPGLEAMAAGAALVCTDAHGNRDYCTDGVNCLMPAPKPDEIAASIQRLIEDPALRGRLGEAARETALRYAPEHRHRALEDFFAEVARGARLRAAPRA